MKRRIFWSVFFTVFLDCRSTNLLRLFSGNLPAMFKICSLIVMIFEVKLEFGQAETGSGAQKRVVLRRENGV